MNVPTDVEILDQKAQIIWADDPDVIFVEAAVDRNAPHGANSEEDKI